MPSSRRWPKTVDDIEQAPALADAAPAPFTEVAAPLPIRCVATSTSPNGPAAENWLPAMLETYG